MNVSIRTRKPVQAVVSLPVEEIDPNPAQPRVYFDEQELGRLAGSIRENGLLQPLTVRKSGKRYTLIAGERRLRALKQAGISHAPCIIVEASDRQAAVLALIENIQRSGLNYFEEAAAFKNLITEWGLSQQELGKKLGMSQPSIANKLRLLRFDSGIRALILEHNLNERQARALLRLETPQQIQRAVEAISARKLNVAQTENYIQSMLEAEQEAKKPHKRFHPIVKDVRLFFNTMNKAISLMNAGGIGASAKKVEKEDCIEYVVRIPLPGGPDIRVAK